MGYKPPKTSSDLVLERSERVASMYCRGKSYREIAEALGLTLGVVSNDMKRIRSIWRQRATRTYIKHLYEQLAKLDECEAAAWDGWQRSLRDELQTGTEDGETPQGKISKTKVNRLTKSGNASFLVAINNTIRQRCELLGLLDPESRNGGGQDVETTVVSVVIDSREEAEQFTSLSLAGFQNLIATTGAE